MPMREITQSYFFLDIRSRAQGTSVTGLWKPTAKTPAPPTPGNRGGGFYSEGGRVAWLAACASGEEEAWHDA